MCVGDSELPVVRQLLGGDKTKTGDVIAVLRDDAFHNSLVSTYHHHLPVSPLAWLEGEILLLLPNPSSLTNSLTHTHMCGVMMIPF